MGIPATYPPPLLEPRLKGLSPGQRPPRPPRRVNSLPDLGPTILAGGQWGSFSLSTCCAGRATRGPSTERATWPPETTSISEPSGASASLYCRTPPRPQSRVRASSQIPGHRVFLHLLVENNRGVKGAACLLEARWDQGMVDRSSLKSRECRLARS